MLHPVQQSWAQSDCLVPYVGYSAAIGMLMVLMAYAVECNMNLICKKHGHGNICHGKKT